MALSKTEKMLAEAVETMLQQDAKLGLAIHAPTEKLSATERGFEYLHNQIDEMFMLRAAELLHAESVCQAFHRIHSYKYLDDPEFRWAMEKEMISTAVPAVERRQALDFLPKIIEELRTEQREWAERDSGFSPYLDEIRTSSQPEQPINFTIHNSPLNQRNVQKVQPGDGSPARTPMTLPLPE